MTQHIRVTTSILLFIVDALITTSIKEVSLHDCFKNFATDASTFLENLEEMFPRYYMQSNVYKISTSTR